MPKLQKVLVIAVLLRFMETFMIYTEPFVVTGGGPGSATTFLSIDLVKIALGQVDLGSAAAMSLVYNLITLTRLLDFLHDHDAARPSEVRLMGADIVSEAGLTVVRGRTQSAATGKASGLLPRLVFAVYLLALMLPIYWLVSMSLRSNEDITSRLAFWPHHPSLEKYFFILSDPTWTHAFLVSLTYVAINTVISVTVALPAAYAFNRYHFIGDKYLFFWLLSLLMAPAAVYAMPFFNLYYAIGLFDTVWAVALAHCLFNVPVAVWILEGFVAGVPREIDEMAAIDGYSFPRFFIRIFLPLIANGVGVTAFFCFMFSWVEQLLATTLTAHRCSAVRGGNDP